METMEQVQAEYNKLCATAGDLQYRIFAMSESLVKVNGQLKELQLKAAELLKASKDDVVKISPAPGADPTLNEGVPNA